MVCLNKATKHNMNILKRNGRKCIKVHVNVAMFYIKGLPSRGWGCSAFREQALMYPSVSMVMAASCLYWQTESMSHSVPVYLYSSFHFFFFLYNQGYTHTHTHTHTYTTPYNALLVGRTGLGQGLNVLSCHVFTSA